MSKRGELYRLPKKGKVAGVCAGIAVHFGIEIWLVRILFISAVLLLGGPFFIFAYIVAWLVLDKAPEGHPSAGSAPRGTDYQDDGKGWKNPQTNGEHIEVKTKIWQAGEPPRQAARDIQMRYQKIEDRLRGLEKYVTSREYQLNREISRL